MSELARVKEAIREKSESIDRLQEEISSLKKFKNSLEEEEQEQHFLRPEPGDFWHDCFSPVLIVLEVGEGFVTICEKTKTVYETPDQAMVMRSYENPEDPEVKAYFAKPRKDLGYTFDLERARKVSRAEFNGMLKCYGGDMKDKLTYRCVVGSALKFVDIWLDKVRSAS